MSQTVPVKSTRAETKTSEQVSSTQDLRCSFLQTITGTQTGHYTGRHLSHRNTEHTAGCFLSLWMKEEEQRRLKSKESSVSSVSLRQQWHHSRQQQQQQRQWQAALTNYSWGLKNATAKELSVYKTPQSAAAVCSWVTTQSYSLREEISLSMEPTWSEKGRNQTSNYQSAFSLTWVESLSQVELCCRNKTTLCDTWAHTERVLKQCELLERRLTS